MAQPTPLIHILRKPPATLPERLSTSARDGATPGESRCEFCAVGIDEGHGHVVDVRRRSLLCVCRACYLLFRQGSAGGARFRSIPDRYVRIAATAAAGEVWDALQIPIGLAFFFTTGMTGRTVGFCPSPAGATTECEFTPEAWRDVVESIPQIASLSPDVEALLVRRSESRTDALIVPIDACYELVGRIRRSWRSVHGGDEVQDEVDGFFARADDLAAGVARIP